MTDLTGGHLPVTGLRVDGVTEQGRHFKVVLKGNQLQTEQVPVYAPATDHLQKKQFTPLERRRADNF